MIKMPRIINIILLLLIGLNSCKEASNQKKITGSAIQYYCVQKLTDVIVYDIFSPPVASRIYAYSNLAYYETIKFAFPSEKSIVINLKGFSNLPSPEATQSYNFELAASVAFMKVAKTLVFSKDSIINSAKVLLEQFGDIDQSVYNRSVSFGESVADIILKRAATDNYKLTRGMPRYSVFKETGKWQQTPPDYSDAVEPYWNKIQPLKMDSAAQFKPLPPPAYNVEKSSVYYKELIEVFDISKNKTKEQDTIAYYWDDNPFVSEHKGHLTYANKKTTPVGHWMGIITILSGSSNKNSLVTAKTFALTSCAIFDAFIACWDEKYRSKMVRPITVIREQFESEWNAFLQTPPFPEYTSGHSVISAAAATVLTKIYGNDFAFNDTTELQYLGMQRSFKSIESASNEAGISRLYGGIHYRSAIENGKEQGKQVGLLYNQLIK